MSLASPERLLWLLVALPIIGFYILKTRLRRRQVATLLFWDQIFEEKRQRSLWQNLRHWLSLLMQLVIVGLLCFAIADPLWTSQADTGQELIMIVDNSASMRAVDSKTGMSRIDEAIREASQMAEGLRHGDQMALMTAGSSVQVVVGMTDFAPAIKDALETIIANDGPTKVTEAIAAARRLSSDAERRRVIVFSDGCLANRTLVPSGEDVRFVQVGKSVDNVGITAFQVRRSTTDPIGYALLVEVQNFGSTDIETRLKLELADSLVDVVPIKLAPGETFRTTIDGTSREGGILVATLDIDDALATDNLARAIVPARPMIPVRLVSDETSNTFYLRSVLQSIPLVQLSEVTGEFDIASATANELTIFSGIVPESLPVGPVLMVDTVSPGPIITTGDNRAPAWIVGQEELSPIIAKQNKESPLLRHVQLQNVILAGGRDVEVNAMVGEATTLLETADGARVLVSVERTDGRLLILAANLDSSDLPLRIAFPVMMTNAMNWFFRESGDMNPALSTGNLAKVAWDVSDPGEANLVQAALLSPDGSHRMVTVNRNEASIGPLAEIGVYGLIDPDALPPIDESAANVPAKTPQERLNQGARGELLAVNLCDANESDLRLPEIASQTPGSLPASGASAWFYLAVIALGVVISEWVLFNRRVIA